ncbi:alpha,alpha-trehalose-phosphate synthase [UDP-forming] 1 [Arachis duranensis]|uniref:alpha,alpha-trehalose-phosphate synthase (UDP-forming) n=1 Tax=Arachis duranensis TaxID=130453 RepID=A0A9C6TIA9_ARADU|nr:alpha,alpha-trehalose-phosphate synthase [UDP-forming] 1 [Arachis duranensis]
MTVLLCGNHLSKCLNLKNLQAKHMRGNNYNCIPITPRSRLERLLRERELRKSNKYFEETRDGNKEAEQVYSDSLTESDSFNSLNEEDISEALAVAKVFPDRSQRPEERPRKQRLLVVANRLPVSAVREGEDSFHLEISVGGLVSALLAFIAFVDDLIQVITMRCIPVFLDEQIVNQYYNGYCNNILWPLFHYLGLPQEDRLATTRSFQSQFDAYKKANQMFADVVNRYYKEGDVVWCHDYHLMFLPKCLKEYNDKMKVGWFLHTPFPSSEIHRTLPSRTELLRSVLAADLVGFHTYDYARHFVSACTRILGLEGTPEGVEDQGKLTRVAAFPIGIDSDRFIRALELPEVQEHMKELKERFAGRKVMLGVDRLDMIKGIPQKILAFEKFLEENPRWRDKVVLLQIAVPTRTNVPDYQKLTSQVHEIVGRINGRFGTLTAVPIHHLDRSLDFYALCALYAVTDVALVTSLRDGMNLVSYEFVACQASKKGVLILSEFAGAAQSLGAGAILVNPWNVTEVAASIGYALDMPADEREKRHLVNFKHVTTHTSQEWAATFVSELNDTIVEAQLRTRQVPPLLPKEVAVDCYSKSNNRLIILGFNATLTEPVDALGRGGQIREMELKLHPNIKKPLKKLSDDPKTTIVVLSGSDRTVLDKNFREYNMWLAAENGMFLRHTSGEWMTTMPENLHMDWVDSVKHVFEYFTERTPRSHFELRETSVVWNYKYADIEFGRLQARDLLQHLWTGPISNASLDVVQGGRSVEVRAIGVSKGAAIDRILGEIVHDKGMKAPIDYVLCIGHFLAKDEDVYKFFEPELPCESSPLARAMPSNSLRSSPLPKFPVSKNGSKAARYKKQRSMSTIEKLEIDHARGDPWIPTYHDRTSLHEGSSVLDLQGDNYFSCAVARKRSSARYLLKTSDDVVNLLSNMADHSSTRST